MIDDKLPRPLGVKLELLLFTAQIAGLLTKKEVATIQVTCICPHCPSEVKDRCETRQSWIMMALNVEEARVIKFNAEVKQ